MSAPHYFHGWEKVNKQRARTVHEHGGPVKLIPCNLRPELEKELDDMPKDVKFDEYVEDYIYHNCFGKATGTYPTYYIGGKH